MADKRTLNNIESLRNGKQISSDAFHAEGMFMNETHHGKPNGMVDPEIHDGGFDKNAGKNPPEEGEMHVGFKMGGGAYQEAAGETAGKTVGAFEEVPAAKITLDASNALHWNQTDGIIALAAGVAVWWFNPIRKTRPYTAIAMATITAMGAYFVSNKGYLSNAVKKKGK